MSDDENKVVEKLEGRWKIVNEKIAETLIISAQDVSMEHLFDVGALINLRINAFA